MKKIASMVLILTFLLGVIPCFIFQNVNAQTPNILDPLSIPQWTNNLEIPPIYTPINITDSAGTLIRQEYAISVTEFKQQILPTLDSDGKATDFGLTTVWGFEGEAIDAISGISLGSVKSTPGGTFEAIQGVPIQAKWTNDLVDASGKPLANLFKVDPTIHWANPNNMEMPNPATASEFPFGYTDAQSPVPISIHLHGGETPSASDGNPLAWWTANGLHGPDYNTAVPTEVNSAVMIYPNQQQPTTLWYHDHSLGITRLTVMSGLAGFYLLNGLEDPIAPLLPSGEYEIPLAIQDRTFLTDGSLYFPSEGTDPSVHPYWNPTFLGNTIMVNGKVWPNMDVNQGQYRLRILDGSNSRYYTLHFSNSMAFTQIGSDGGYLKTPAQLTSLTIAPGERVDLLVDFSMLQPGEKVTLQNQDIFLTADEKKTVGQIAQFTVTSQNGETPKTLPANLNPTLNGDFPSLPAPTKTRTFTLIEQGVFPKTDALLLDGQLWGAPTSEKPELGTAEEWVIVNPTMGSHPIHLHLVQFQLVQRQLLNSASYLESWIDLNGEPPLNHTTVNVSSLDSYLLGSPAKPKLNEQCWKDTIQADAGSVTTIRIRFAPEDGSNYQFDPTSGPGYVWHCHILDHEDNEMMRPLVVINSSNNNNNLNTVYYLIAVVTIVVLVLLTIFRKRIFKPKTHKTTLL
jgi:spore coat protein A